MEELIINLALMIGTFSAIAVLAFIFVFVEFRRKPKLCHRCQHMMNCEKFHSEGNQRNCNDFYGNIRISHRKAV